MLRAYERRCAVCGFDLRLGSVDVALEAAHIMWHQAGGPDIECNGLALCSLHHKLLDRGAFTVSAERRVLVSQEVSGSAGVEEHLLRFHAGAVREPQSSEYLAKPEYLVAWDGGVSGAGAGGITLGGMGEYTAYITPVSLLSVVGQVDKVSDFPRGKFFQPIPIRSPGAVTA